MIMELKIKKNKAEPIVISIFIGIVCLLTNYIGILDYDVELESILFIALISIFCFKWLIKQKKQEMLLVSIGYVIRILLLYIDIYGRSYITLPSSGADSENFWFMALQLYRNVEKDTLVLTKYPYFIEFMMRFFGENRVLVQYMNILFWFFTVVVLYKIMQLLEITGNVRLLCVVIISFFSGNILFSSILLRESLIILLNTISAYYVVCWYQKKNIWDVIKSVMAVLFSAVLHSGAIGIVMAVIIFVAVYDVKRSRLGLSKKTVVILSTGFFAVIFAYLSPFKSLFLEYIPRISSIYEIQDKFFAAGGADYLRGMPYTTNLFVFAGYTIIRIIYFFVSPMPWECRGLSDLIAFGMDGLFHLTVLVVGIYNIIRNKKYSPLVIFCLFCLLCSGGVFAWGVSNAGTAMRHRNKLIGLEVVLLLCCLKQKCERDQL